LTTQGAGWRGHRHAVAARVGVALARYTFELVKCSTELPMWEAVAREERGVRQRGFDAGGGV
jgi:hypothetical protein